MILGNMLGSVFIGSLALSLPAVITGYMGAGCSRSYASGFIMYGWF